MKRIRKFPILLILFFSAVASCVERRIIPEFSITPEDLRDLAKRLPEPVGDGILARPEEFLRLAVEVLDEPEEFFILVDKNHPLPAGFIPPDLVSLDNQGLRVTRSGLFLRKAIMPDVLRMADAALAEGIEITFSSAYRSYGYQGAIYKREVRTYGRKTADRQSARPGFSQHQLGTAVDFGSISDGYEKTLEGAWLTEHAWEYGFSLSYPAGYEDETGYRYESWHYRYITPAGARMQREFFGDIQQYFLQFLHDNRVYLVERMILNK